MKNTPFTRAETSLKLAIAIVLLFFILTIAIVLEAPRFVDASWLSPSSPFQVQMYEILDKALYISPATLGKNEVQEVHHVQSGSTLFAYIETEKLRLIADDSLKPYLTPYGDPTIKLTHKLLLLRTPENLELHQKKKEALTEAFEKKDPLLQVQGLKKPEYTLLELYDPQQNEAFIITAEEDSLEHWIDTSYTLLEPPSSPHKKDEGFLYAKNPLEYRIKEVKTQFGTRFIYDPKGQPLSSLSTLTSPPFCFTSRKELIEEGEKIYAQEGCWYCHTDQTRTLVQDVVLNGSESYPSPPSSANEYIYQNISFPGTRRIGPDLSRTGIKKPFRDWHKTHFWSPTLSSPGTIMPSFRHFFDTQPQDETTTGTPNKKFEAIYQYLMTKGTRITAPNQAWWLGKDPLHIKELIETRPSGD